MMTPFVVGRESSVQFSKAMAGTKIFLATQHASIDEPKPNETTASEQLSTCQSLKLPDGNITCWWKASAR
jgi:hypothetical protein